MSYFNLIKDTENILALVESIDEQRKLETKDAVAGSQSADPFAIDDLTNTVDIDDQESGIESPVNFSKEDITLDDDTKSIVRKNLQAMLDEISGEEISVPALEMILEEVANRSAYLSESEESSVETPVEKTSLLKTKKDAIIDYAKEVLQLGIDNDGVIPDDASEEPSTEELGDVPSNEEANEIVTDEIEGGEPTEEETLTESDDADADDEEEELTESVEDVGNIEEGVCTECGEEPVGSESDIVDVDPSDVIKVVDDSEVEPIDIDVEFEPTEDEVGGDSSKIDELSAKIDQLTDIVSKLAGNQSAVFEAAGLFNEYKHSDIEGKDPKINTGAQHSDFQKKITPKTTSGELKLAELRELTSSPKKATPASKEGRENESARASANAGNFKKDSRDQGKSQTAPESGYAKAVSTAGTAKKPSASKEVPVQVKAAVVREAAEYGAKSFLEEAKRIIREGK